MEALAGPFTIAAVILAAAGVMKVVDPLPTQGALRAMGLPWRRPLVRGLGVGELVLGVAALVLGWWWIVALVALSYLAFAVFVAVALRRSTPLASCGCFGREDTPPTLLHLFVNLAFFSVSGAVALRPFGPLDVVLGDQPARGIPFLGWTAVGVYATYLVLAVLPRTLVLVGARTRPTP